MIKVKSLKPIHYLVIFLGIALYFGVVIGVIDYQSRRKAEPLSLNITSPIEGDVYSTPDVLIEGSTAPEATITIEETKYSVDSTGQFSLAHPLVEGKNSLKIISTKSSQSAERVINVTRQPQKVTKKTKSAPVDTYEAQSELNNTGPESFWLLEAGALSAAAVSWQMSRAKLKKTLNK